MENNTLTAKRVADAAYDAIRAAAVGLREDVLCGLAAARKIEEQPRAQSVLDCLLENAQIAREDGVPLCQDTGTCWVRLEVGEELSIPGDVLSQVDDAVARAYTDGRLRMSVVRDALFDRANTGDNTPAFAEIATRPGHGATLHVLLKGGGSDNASRVVATFDKVAGLAKHALLREIGSPAASPKHAAFERELLEAINATGIGPGALGGKTTALAVHLETAPCHIAALPVAVNMGCSAMRSVSIDLLSWED